MVPKVHMIPLHIAFSAKGQLSDRTNYQIKHPIIIKFYCTLLNKDGTKSLYDTFTRLE